MVAVFDDGLPARRVYKIQGQTLSIEEAGETIESRELIDPFQFVSDTQAKYSYPIIEGYPHLRVVSWATLGMTPFGTWSHAWQTVHRLRRSIPRTFC